MTGSRINLQSSLAGVTCRPPARPTFAPMTARAIPSRSDLPFNPEDVRPTWCRVVEGTRVGKLRGVVWCLGDGLEVVRSVRAGAHGAFARIVVDLKVDFLFRLARRTQVVAVLRRLPGQSFRAAFLLEVLVKFGFCGRVRSRCVAAAAGIGRLGGGVRRNGYSVSHRRLLSGVVPRSDGPAPASCRRSVPVTVPPMNHR